MGSVIIGAVLALPLLAQIELVNSAGRLEGSVVDATGAAVGAMVRVRQEPTGIAILKLNATDRGVFQTKPLPAGLYSLTFFSPGFRRRTLRNVAIKAGHTAVLGEIKLDLSGCDAPSTNCDYFGEVPDDIKRIIADGHVILQLQCAADLDRSGEPVCPGRDGVTKVFEADIRLAMEKSTMYLAAENGAAFSTIQPPTSDCSRAEFRSTRLAVAGLGPGVDFCVQTRRGAVSHVFFTDDADNGSSDVSLWYVTRIR